MIELAPSDCDLSALVAGDKQLIRLRADAAWHPPENRQADIRNALVIGANGFVGVHLVHELACDPRIARVVCLVRPGDDQTPEERVHRTLQTYGLQLTDQQLNKCEFIGGRYTESRLGLTEDDYAKLADTIDAVYHVAGATDYEPSYEDLREQYVLSLLQLLSLCGTGRPKQLHYLSSTIRRLFQTEADFQRFSWWYSGYARMKWVNSQILIRARSDIGAEAFIYDAPYIVGSTTRGQDPGLAYSFWRAVIACSLMGQIWDGSSMEFVPVNLLCQAFVANTFRPEPLGVVTPTIDTLWNRDVADHLQCELIDPVTFFSHARDTVLPKRRRIFQDASYDNIIKAACPDQLGELIGTENLPSSIDVFLRGFHQPSIQAALHAARSHPA